MVLTICDYLVFRAILYYTIAMFGIWKHGSSCGPGVLPREPNMAELRNTDFNNLGILNMI